MTGMRKIVEKCRSWCSKEDKTGEVGHGQVQKSGRATTTTTTTEAAFAGPCDSGFAGRGDVKMEELLLMEMQRATCLNCNLIAMGEMLAYADGRCPRCGNMTPR